MADDDRIITPTQLQPTQIEVDKQLLRDEDLLNEEHLRRMDQVLLRRNLDHARMFSRKLSLELQDRANSDKKKSFTRLQGNLSSIDRRERADPLSSFDVSLARGFFTVKGDALDQVFQRGKRT